jgi:DNA-binding transcriptional regulator YdaS (Cro superfamily)
MDSACDRKEAVKEPNFPMRNGTGTVERVAFRAPAIARAAASNVSRAPARKTCPAPVRRT